MTRQELEPPSSAPLARLREPAWARRAGLGAARLAQALGAAAWRSHGWCRLLGAAFLALAFLADFFGAAALDFLADFFADFFADFLAFFADFFADFFEVFFADFFFAVRSFFLLLLSCLFALFSFSHRDPPVAADPCLSSVSSRPLSRAGPIDQFNPGRGPPVAQSRSSIVCTTGTDVPPAICTMHPILPAAIMSGLTIAILATFRSRNLFAMSGWRMLYVPAEPQHKWLSGTSFTTNPFLESNSFGSCVIFCPCCSEQAE